MADKLNLSGVMRCRFYNYLRLLIDMMFAENRFQGLAPCLARKLHARRLPVHLQRLHQKRFQESLQWCVLLHK